MPDRCSNHFIILETFLNLLSAYQLIVFRVFAGLFQLQWFYCASNQEVVLYLMLHPHMAWMWGLDFGNSLSVNPHKTETMLKGGEGGEEEEEKMISYLSISR
jgi:hypothetical protein